MSIELFVFSDRQVSSMAEWQKAIDTGGFALRLSERRPLGALSGHLPAQLDGENVWLECDHFDAAELTAHWSEIDFGHPWKFVLAFRIGASFKALLGAWIAATAFATATDGIVFDETEAKLYRPGEALSLACGLERDMPRLQQQIKELRERPRNALNPSPAIISVRIWKGEEDEK